MLKRIIILLVDELQELVRAFVIYFPTSYTGGLLRRKYYRRLLRGHLGKKAQIGRGTQIYHEAPISIGDEFYTGPGVVISPNQSFGIIIGNHVSIAPGAFIRAGNHNYYSLDKVIQKQGHVAKKLVLQDGRLTSIVIEDDVLIGAYAVILSGTKIGKGSVIAPGTVVSFEVPPYSLVAGNPGRVFANRQQINFSKGYEAFP